MTDFYIVKNRVPIVRALCLVVKTNDRIQSIDFEDAPHRDLALADWLALETPIPNTPHITEMTREFVVLTMLGL